jgi:putative heme iron utilization protein
MDTNTKNALELLKFETTGILSTHSLELEGYPFGSVTPYSLDQGFNPIILVSSIAQHTKNMDHNPKVSLTIAQSSGDSEKQALGRYTVVADAIKIESGTDDWAQVSETYLRYYPSAKSYFEAHDFYFYRLKFVRGRYIGGFGKIYWIEPSDWQIESVFSSEEERQIIEHMNEDHQKALKKYCTHFKKIELKPDDQISMVGIYQFGMDLLNGDEKISFNFESEVKNATQAREILVNMAKA